MAQGLGMDPSHRALLTSLAVLLVCVGLVGIVLIAIPYSGPRFVEEGRAGVELWEGIGMGSSIDLRRGPYEVWAEDINPGILDHSSIELEMDVLGEAVAIEMSHREIQRDLDGMPCEVVCTLTIPHSDSYSYDISLNGPELNDTMFELIFMRHATRLDQPTFVAGLALAVTATICVPIIFLVLRRSPRGPGA
jgi:hypothetical protein